MADNLNTTYLGQPAAADNINTPFLPETTSEATVNIKSDISTEGGVFAQGVGDIGGNLAVGGTLAVTGVTTLSAALNSASAISAAVVTATQFSATSNDFMSANTVANATSMAVGELRLVFAASGMSLVVSSGDSFYDIGSATSAAQA